MILRKISSTNEQFVGTVAKRLNVFLAGTSIVFMSEVVVNVVARCTMSEFKKCVYA